MNNANLVSRIVNAIRTKASPSINITTVEQSVYEHVAKIIGFHFTCNVELHDLLNTTNKPNYISVDATAEDDVVEFVSGQFVETLTKQGCPNIVIHVDQTSDLAFCLIYACLPMKQDESSKL